MNLSIVTISTADWLDKHAFRWLRYARSSNPDAKLHLILVGEPDEQGHKIADMFDVVKQFGQACKNRDFFNTIRMSATTEFDLKETIYCDLDCDILQPLDYVPEFCDKALMWVRSPSVSEEWQGICAKNKWAQWGANNGFLYLRKDYKEPYVKWLAQLKKDGASQRLVGTYAFNAMIRELADENAELPYYTSVVWWDYRNILTAKTIQYCNDRGQSKRLMLEQEWRNAVPDNVDLFDVKNENNLPNK